MEGRGRKKKKNLSKCLPFLPRKLLMRDEKASVVGNLTSALSGNMKTEEGAERNPRLTLDKGPRERFMAVSRGFDKTFKNLTDHNKSLPLPVVVF